MTEAKFIPAIILGYVLFALSTVGIVVFNFADFFHNPNSSKVIIAPERYLQTGILIFVAMIITGYILTEGWSEVDYSDNPLITYYGYNNVCLYFDTSPAKYVVPIFGSLVAYFIVSYAVEDCKRSWHLPYLSRTVKIFAQYASIQFSFSVCLFPVIFAIGPGDDMLGHTIPFLILILSLPLLYISHYLQQEKPSRVHLIAVVLYCLVSGVKASFTTIALATRHHLPRTIAQPIDFLWVGLAIPAPFLYPPPHDPTRQQSIRDAELRAKYIGIIASPLYILLLPFILVSTLVHMSSGLFRRLWAVLTSASPDADKNNFPRIHPTDLEKGPLCPIKLATLYLGDIFGYFTLLRGWNAFAWHYIKKLGGAKVFAMNVGLPVLSCFDVKSAESFFLGRTALNDLFVPFDRYVKDSLITNFYRVGDVAVRFRRLFLSIQSTQTSDDSFREGVKEMKDYLSHLSDRVDHKSFSSPLIDDCASKCARRFACGMLFGGSLDDELMENVYPLPVVSLLFPYFPNWLFPPYYKVLTF